MLEFGPVPSVPPTVDEVVVIVIFVVNDDI